MGVKDSIALIGLMCVIGGIITMWYSIVTGFMIFLLGLTIAVVIMFWGFGGTFQNIIDKHTGVYKGDYETKPKPAKRKWE